jgi:hypothetical protein
MIAKNKKISNETKIQETFQFFQQEFLHLTKKFPDLMECFEYFSGENQMMILGELERMAKNFTNITSLLTTSEKQRVKVSEEIEIMIIKRPGGAQVIMLTNNFENLLKIDLVNGEINTTEVFPKSSSSSQF